MTLIQILEQEMANRQKESQTAYDDHKDGAAAFLVGTMEGRLKERTQVLELVGKLASSAQGLLEQAFLRDYQELLRECPEDKHGAKDVVAWVRGLVHKLKTLDQLAIEYGTYPALEETAEESSLAKQKGGLAHEENF